MAYVDAGVFIAAAIGLEPESENAKKLLRFVEEEKISCNTSALSIDEVFWTLARKTSRTIAIQACKSMLQSKTHIIPTTTSILSEAINILETTSLKPRDAIHVASMHAAGDDQILTCDNDFAKIKQLCVLTPSQFLYKHKL